MGKLKKKSQKTDRVVTIIRAGECQMPYLSDFYSNRFLFTQPILNA